MKMNYFEKVKKELNLEIPDELMISLVFEMTRKKDKEFVKELQKIQKEYDIVFNTVMRNKMRKVYYFKDKSSDFGDLRQYNIGPFTYSKDELREVFEDFYNRLHKYESEKIIKSLK